VAGPVRRPEWPAVLVHDTYCRLQQVFDLHQHLSGSSSECEACASRVCMGRGPRGVWGLFISRGPFRPSWLACLSIAPVVLDVTTQQSPPVPDTDISHPPPLLPPLPPAALSLSPPPGYRCLNTQYVPSSAHDSSHWTTNSGAPVWNNNNSLTGEGAGHWCQANGAGGKGRAGILSTIRRSHDSHTAVRSLCAD
jgi:hypothetical protein